MANYRIINGKNTRERMQEEFQKLLVTRLRKRISELERELSALKEEEDSRKKRVALDNQLRVQKAQNERLRGIIISLQQEILRYTPPELSRRLMKMIEEHAGATDEDEDEDVE